VTPKQVVDRLEEVFWPEGEPRRLVEAVELELVNTFGATSIAASERAEQLSGRVSQLITERLVACDSQGTVPRLVLLGTALDVVAGGCHRLRGDDAVVSFLKRSRQQADLLLNAMRSLDFNQFEHFGMKVLTELGATKAEVTPSSGDQGIDFFGELSLGELMDHPPPFLKLARDIRLGFVGQAKHYPTRTIGPDVVREIAGAVALARAGAFSREKVDLFDRIDLKSHSPIVTLLLTTGSISSGATHLAAAAGIIARSGEQLAVFLAEKGVGMRDDGSGPVFDNSAFKEWLSPA
jgi:Restriction endonuclease